MDKNGANKIKSFQAFLSMQHPASQPVINPATIDNALLEEYIAPRFLRKMKSKVIIDFGQEDFMERPTSLSCNKRLQRAALKR
jgi:hypothetical protein